VKTPILAKNRDFPQKPQKVGFLAVPDPGPGGGFTSTPRGGAPRFPTGALLGTRPTPRRDKSLQASTALESGRGVFLEMFGTSLQCWFRAPHAYPVYLLTRGSWAASERPASSRDGDPAQGDHPFLEGVSPRGQQPPAGNRGAPARGVDVKPPRAASRGPRGPGLLSPSQAPGGGGPRIPGSGSRGPGPAGQPGRGPGGLPGAPRALGDPSALGVDVKPLRREGPEGPKRPKNPVFGVFPTKRPILALFDENGHFWPFFRKNQLAS